MTEQEVYDLLVETGAIMNGHFKLTSGLHSPHYVEKFKFDVAIFPVLLSLQGERRITANGKFHLSETSYKIFDKNNFVRSSFGFSKTSLGLPCSTM